MDCLNNLSYCCYDFLCDNPLVNECECDTEPPSMQSTHISKQPSGNESSPQDTYTTLMHLFSTAVDHSSGLASLTMLQNRVFNLTERLKAIEGGVSLTMLQNRVFNLTERLKAIKGGVSTAKDNILTLKGFLQENPSGEIDFIIKKSESILKKVENTLNPSSCNESSVPIKTEIKDLSQEIASRLESNKTSSNQANKNLISKIHNLINQSEFKSFSNFLNITGKISDLGQKHALKKISEHNKKKPVTDRVPTLAFENSEDTDTTKENIKRVNNIVDMINKGLDEINDTINNINKDADAEINKLQHEIDVINQEFSSLFSTIIKGSIPKTDVGYLNCNCFCM